MCISIMWWVHVMCREPTSGLTSPWHHHRVSCTQYSVYTVLSLHSTHIVLVVLSSKKLHSHRIHLIYVWLLKFVPTDTLTPLTSAPTHLCHHMITHTWQQHLYWCLHRHHHRSWVSLSLCQCKQTCVSNKTLNKNIINNRDWNNHYYFLYWSVFGLLRKNETFTHFRSFDSGWTTWSNPSPDKTDHDTVSAPPPGQEAALSLTPHVCVRVTGNKASPRMKNTAGKTSTNANETPENCMRADSTHDVCSRGHPAQTLQILSR